MFGGFWYGEFAIPNIDTVEHLTDDYDEMTDSPAKMHHVDKIPVMSVDNKAGINTTGNGKVNPAYRSNSGMDASSCANGDLQDISSQTVSISKLGTRSEDDKDKDYVVISGSTDTVQKSQTESHNNKNDEDPNCNVQYFSDRKTCKFYSRSKGVEFVRDCAVRNNVLIHQRLSLVLRSGKIMLEEDVLVHPDGTFSQKSTWYTDTRKSIQLQRNEDSNSIQTKGPVVHVRFEQAFGVDVKYSETIEGFVADVDVPTWSTGCKSRLEVNLRELFKLFDTTESFTFILPVDPPKDWDARVYTETIVKKSVEVVLDIGITSQYSVCLEVGDQQRFDYVAKQTRKLLRKYVSDNSNLKKQMKILVVEGELSKAKVDAVVNTTSKNLDLSLGKVSSALSKAAGPELQHECKIKYPDGIGSLVLAVTNGFRLPCQKVFHVALDTFNPEKLNESIESIRGLVYMGLDKANQMGLQTIAFPALGTGTLRYPVDIVAASMFEGVERFREKFPDTMLEEVQFVIYYTDKALLQEFRKHEEILATPKVTHFDQIKSSVEFEIRGQPVQVAKAKECFKEKIDDIYNNPGEVITANFSNLSRSDFLRSTVVHKADFQKLKTKGISVSHHNNCLTFIGQRNVLKNEAKETMEMSQKFQKLSTPCVVMALPSSYPQDVPLEVVERQFQINSPNKDLVTCVYDRYIGLIYVSGQTYEQIKTIKRKLEEELLDKLSDDQKRTPIEQPDHFSSIEDSSLKASTDSKSPQTFMQAESLKVNDMNGNDPEKSNQNVAVQETYEHVTCDQKQGANNEVPSESDNLPSLFSEPRSHRHGFSVGTSGSSFTVRSLSVHVYNTDILLVKADCIVNPANKSLSHLGGLAYTIAKAGGKKVNRESQDIVRARGGALPVSTVVATSGFGQFKRILHAVGPCWYDYKSASRTVQQCERDLHQTILNCLSLADSLRMQSVVLPTVSSGLYGVPKDLCTTQYARAVLSFSERNKTLEEIHFVDTDLEMVEKMKKSFKKILENRKDPIDTKVNDQACLEKSQKDKNPSMTMTHKRSASIENPEDLSYIENNGKLLCMFYRHFQILISQEDILKLVDKDALVCSETRSGEGLGMITKHLLPIAGQKYKKDKAKKFKIKRSFGDIVTTDGGDSHFRYILHAIVPRKEPKALHMMYSNLFEEAMTNANIRSLALPLLGTGSGSFTVDTSCSILLQEWSTFCKRRKIFPRDGYLFIHLALPDPITADSVKCMFKRHIDDSGQGKHNKDIVSKTENCEDVSIKDNSKKAYSEPPMEENCVICLDKLCEETKLECGHIFCKECIEGYFKVKQVCPTCGYVCGILYGDQPNGIMEVKKIDRHLAGYEGYKTIAITYAFPIGIQSSEHPNPGAVFQGITRIAFLPDNQEGREVCAMLMLAFERKLVFTIGTSRTTGQEGVITWNDIHHKTDLRPHTQFGYPDDTYLQRVTEELAVKGVKKGDIKPEVIRELENDSYRFKVKCRMD